MLDSDVEMRPGAAAATTKSGIEITVSPAASTDSVRELFLSSLDLSLSAYTFLSHTASIDELVGREETTHLEDGTARGAEIPIISQGQAAGCLSPSYRCKAH